MRIFFFSSPNLDFFECEVFSQFYPTELDASVDEKIANVKKEGVARTSGRARGLDATSCER